MRTLESAELRYWVKLSGNVLSLAFQANVSPGQCSKLYPQTLTRKNTPVSPGEQSLPLTVKYRFQFRADGALLKPLIKTIGGKNGLFLVQIAFKSCSNEHQITVK